VERVEIKDVKLPQQLQRAMAAEAEASREARAKVTWVGIQNFRSTVFLDKDLLLKLLIYNCWSYKFVWNQPCLKKNMFYPRSSEKQNYTTHNPKHSSNICWLVQLAVSTETFTLLASG